MDALVSLPYSPHKYSWGNSEQTQGEYYLRSRDGCRWIPVSNVEHQNITTLKKKKGGFFFWWSVLPTALMVQPTWSCLFWNVWWWLKIPMRTMEDSPGWHRRHHPWLLSREGSRRSGLQRQWWGHGLALTETHKARFAYNVNCHIIVCCPQNYQKLKNLPKQKFEKALHLVTARSVLCNQCWKWFMEHNLKNILKGENPKYSPTRYISEQVWPKTATFTMPFLVLQSGI